MATYRTFKRSATNFEEFSAAQKTTDSEGLTLEEARQRGQDWNSHRTASQVAKGTKMEFERED